MEKYQHIIKIENPNDERIGLYRNLNFTPKLHTIENVCIAEGIKSVRKMIRSNVDLLSIFSAEKYHTEIDALLSENLKYQTQLFSASPEMMSAIAGFKLHEPVMAIGRIPDFSKLDELGGKICVLNGIVNSENVGSIVRNALAFGVDSIIFDLKTSSPYLRRAVRVSMGSVFFVKVHCSADLAADLIKLKEQDYQLVSAEISEESIPINEFAPKSKVCYIFGTESQGVDKELLNISDVIVEIPINKQADSLNVAASSAIVLQAAAYRRQEAGNSSHVSA